ncbi:MAG: serine/threonine-protein kinase, partial [Myxococcota bacterium]
MNTGPDGDRIVDPDDVPTRIGRYEVDRLLGAGGMGSVFAGRDLELDRHVAIKVIHAASSHASDSYRERLIREAQALAALSHPNVVTVFEVGAHDGAVYIAMELVEGPTLADWSQEPGRSWAEVLAMYIQAGRGLVAAHDKGIVHRDFKPMNVIVGSDGRARVLDFGLATADGSVSGTVSRATPSERPSGTMPLGSNPLTAAGVVMGTPAYMAPEQMRRKRVTAATDQFSFCVALWEALVGNRPFPGDTFASLRQALSGGERSPVPSGLEVPRRVLKILDRGLQVRPELRWPTMGILLARLHAATRPSRVWVRGGLVVGVAALGVGAWFATRSRDHRCDAGARPGQLPWNDAQRHALRQAYAQAPETASTWSVVDARLQQYAADWGAAFERVCDGGVAGAGDQSTFDLRVGCLHQRSGAVDRVLEVLAAGDAEALSEGPATVSALPPVEPCLDAVQGDPATDLPSDPERARRVADLRAELSRIDALMSAGRLDEAETEAQALAGEAASIDFTPLTVEAEVQLGIVESRLNRSEDAERRLTAAFWTASDVGHDVIAATAALELGWLVGYLKGRHLEGIEWARHYEAAWTRTGGDPQANLDAVLGPIYFDLGKFDLAFPILERRLQLELSENADTHDAAVAQM